MYLFARTQVTSLFRPFALVKSAVLLRDPYSSLLSTSLAYVEFHSVEHAQYALASYTEAVRNAQGSGNGEAHASAAFAEVKSMLRLKKEVSLFEFPH